MMRWVGEWVGIGIERGGGGDHGCEDGDGDGDGDESRRADDNDDVFAREMEMNAW